MNHDADYRIDADSFPTFLHQFKLPSAQPAIEEGPSISFDNESCITPDVKSLKEHLKSIEFEKKRLEIDLEAVNHKFSKEKESLQKQIKELQESVSATKADLQKAQEELNKIKKKSKDSIEKSCFLESQVEFLTKENKRIAEQHRIDKENWELQLKKSKRNSKSEDKDSSRTQVLLTKAEGKIADLTSEIQELKTKNDLQKASYQKKIDHVEGEVRKLKLEEEKYIKELENKNKENEEIIVQLNKRIRDIETQLSKTPEKLASPMKSKHSRSEKQIEKSLSVSEKLLKSSKSPLLQSPKGQKTKSIPIQKRSSSSVKDSNSSAEINRKKTPLRDQSLERNSNLPVPRVHNKAPSYLRKENQASHIEAIEKEIAVLTGRYKYLLQMSQDAADLVSLRTEISKIAGEIEEKSSQLFDLKKKQQDFLKQQVKS